MKRMIVGARRDRSKFGYANHRKGKVYFDNIEIYDRTFPYNGLTQKVCDMNFTFDTVAHINYAAYADPEDWTSEDLADAVTESIDVRELIDTWSDLAIQHMSEVPDDCVCCKVVLTMYGIGNKSIDIYTVIYGEQIGNRGSATFDYSNIHTLFDGNKFVATDPEVYSTLNASPNKLKILIREAIKYLTRGL